MSRVHTLRRFFVCLLAILPFRLFAAEPIAIQPISAQPDLPVVTASTALDHMRFTSTAAVAQIRVEVTTADGLPVFDSGWQGGNVFDWALIDRDSHKLAGGSYQVAVSVRDLDGHVTAKRARLSVASDQIAVEPAAGDEGMAVTVPENLMKVTIVAHDGKAGAVASTSGDLTFRTGDYFAGLDSEGMRLTADGKVGIGTDQPTERLDVHGMVKADGFILSDGTVVSTTVGQGLVTRTATRPGSVLLSAPGAEAVAKGQGFKAVANGLPPNTAIALGGQSPQVITVDQNPTPSTPGNALSLISGSPLEGSTDTTGGDLLLQPGAGTGLGSGGNLRLQTAGANSLSGTANNVVVDRMIVVARGKQMTLSAPGITSLMSIHLVGTNTAGGRVFYMVRATDGGSQIATEEGVIQYLATANSITCTVQTTDKLHFGTVNSSCTPGFFNPGSQPGLSIGDNVTFSITAPIVVHEVYFTIHNDSGSSIRLEP